MKEKNLYFECNSGISGDMAVAALLDLGADKNALLKTLDSIPAEGFKIEITDVLKNGIRCCDFNVILDHKHENHDHDTEYLFSKSHHHEHEHHHHHEHRNLGDILHVIGHTELSENAKNLAGKIFRIVAEAESEAHGVPVEEVHFHEVGAIDSIVDIIAFAFCFDDLGIERVFIPHLCEGTGEIRCQHGILPIPVPAVVNIVQKHGLVLQMAEMKGELVTPTGAAIAAAVRTDGTLPELFKIAKTGLGAGKRNYEKPSILRTFLIEEPEKLEETHEETPNKITKLEANIDDSTGEALGFAMEQLFEAGALDAFYTPCFMKKNRPAYMLTVLCRNSDVEKMEDIIFNHTTTIGIRRCTMERTVLEREELSVRTPYGNAKIKLLIHNNRKRFAPEYESVAEISRKTGISFGKIYNELISLCKAQF
ncbi:nickel pincer cofactor biosynthesis protein LarC [bacterium]|nr:nickel pincer cofactor biosynthesis protein LarC [bacterium]